MKTLKVTQTQPLETQTIVFKYKYCFLNHGFSTVKDDCNSDTVGVTQRINRINRGG